MPALVLGLAVLLLFVAIGRGYIGADPRKLSRQLRYGGGILAILAGALLTVIGRAGLGVPLVFVGLSLLGRNVLPGFGGRASGGGGSAKNSRVRSAYLEMTLDHAAGALDGRIVAGRFAGRSLSSLSRAEVPALAAELAAADPQGSVLLEAYLDRRHPGWREDLHGNAGGGRGQPAGEAAMTQEQAYQVLGLEAGAGAEEIRRAHWALMKKIHPDQGGSTYLAAQVNAAKELLLRGHR